MISVLSTDSGQVGHLTSLNVTVILLQLAYGSKGLPRSKLMSPFQQYFSHIGIWTGEHERLCAMKHRFINSVVLICIFIHIFLHLLFLFFVRNAKSRKWEYASRTRAWLASVGLSG